jgi:nucleotide-binding universal stress UspA family protein
VFKHILVPYDFAEASERALETAIELAGIHGSRLTILHVCEIPASVYEEIGVSPIDLLTPFTQAAEERLKTLLRQVQARRPGTDGVFKLGSVHEGALAAVASRGCDLLVMGTHGRRGLAHAALGSVAEKLVRLSPVPVLTVHARIREVAP